MAIRRRGGRKKGRGRRGGNIKDFFRKTNAVGRGLGSVLRTFGIGKQVKSARNIVSKGALGMLKRKMAGM